MHCHILRVNISWKSRNNSFILVDNLLQCVLCQNAKKMVLFTSSNEGEFCTKKAKEKKSNEASEWIKAMKPTNSPKINGMNFK